MGRPKRYETNAERQAAYRSRQKNGDTVVDIPFTEEQMERLEARAREAGLSVDGYIRATVDAAVAGVAGEDLVHPDGSWSRGKKTYRPDPKR